MFDSVEDAFKAIDAAVEDTLRDQPHLKPQEDDVYHDLAKCMMMDCAPNVKNEVARRTGIDQY